MKSERARIVRGCVNANGTIALGTGFIVSKINLGLYSIIFTPPFKSPPIMTANTLGAAGIVAISGSPGASTAATYNGSFATADETFNFIAIGASD